VKTHITINVIHDHSDRSSVVNNDHSTNYNASAGSNPDAMAVLESKVKTIQAQSKVLNDRVDELQKESKHL
jgi:hypothetical protein